MPVNYLHECTQGMAARVEDSTLSERVLCAAAIKD
jgi:hypothetical protein